MLVVALVGGRYLASPFGFADNGDFWRVMAPAGIEYRSPMPARYREFAAVFSVTSPDLGSATTSAVLPAWAASRFGGELDIRRLGFLCFATFLVGLAFLFRALGGWVFWIGFSWLALDPAYFLHFNSFYSQALALALLPWLLWALHGYARSGSGKLLWALSVLSLLIATSKLQFVLLPLVLALAMRPRRRASLPLLAATALALALSFLPDSAPRRGLRLMNRYQSVFTGIAPLSSDASGVLRSLGIPENYHYMSGYGMYDLPTLDKVTPELSAHLERISLGKIASLYLTHPEAVAHALPRLADGLAVTRIDYLGNYPQGAARPGMSLDPGWRWANVRDFFYRVPLLPWLISLGALAYLFRVRRRPETWHCVLLFLALDFLVQLPAAILGDGTSSFSRHLIGGRIDLDLIALLALDRAVTFYRETRPTP